ncbi:hypothetical protein ACXM0N_19765 [Peribacillus simplex]
MDELLNKILKKLDDIEAQGNVLNDRVFKLEMENKKSVKAEKDPNMDLDVVEDIDVDVMAEPSGKPKKSMKGIYIEEDVLEVYEKLSDENSRGWGSQLVSDLLRAKFEKHGYLPKR